MQTQRQQNHGGVYVALDELLALRRVGSHKPVASRHPVHSALPGDSKSPARGRGIEFTEVRPYQAGDDIRSIDWRVSARTGKPFTKLYAEERERPAYIAVDQRVSMFFGSGAVFKSVVAARLAAMIGWYSLAAGDRVGALVVGESIQRIRSSTTRRSVLQFLQLLTRANQALHALSQSSLSLNEVLCDCLLHTSKGTTVTIISDFHDVDEHCFQSILALARNRRLILINITDPLEATFPAGGDFGISNGIDTSRVVVGKAQQQRYSEQRAVNEQHLNHFVENCSAQLLAVSTMGDTASIMSRYVRTR